MRHFIFSAVLILIFLPLLAAAQTPGNAKLLEELLDFPAPPRVVKDAKETGEKKRPAEFFDSRNVPADNAPIGDLLDYWKYQSSNYNDFRYNVKPSKESLKAILEALEENPAQLSDFLSILPTDPEVAEVVKRIYERELQSDDLNSSLLQNVRNWLKYHSDTFITELQQGARTVNASGNGEDGAGIENQNELISLAEVDWDLAMPIVEQLETKDSASPLFTLAQYVRYHHALAAENKSETKKFRSILQKIVENKKAPYKSRDLAMDALVLGGDYEGRTEWYLSLLADETLLELQENGFTGLTTLPRHSPRSREDWIPQMVKLLGSDNPSVRSAAVRNLIKIADINNPDVIKGLLPWLADPEWAKESDDDERLSLIRMLGEMDVPESVPGLISVVLKEEEDLRASAAKALGRYRAPEAASALRHALQNETDSDYRKEIISGLIACGGLTAFEQMTGLEAYAAQISTEEGEEAYENYTYGYDEDDTPPMPVEVSIGEFLSEIEDPSGELAYQVIKRVGVLRRENPPVAAILLGFMQKWDHRLIDLEMFNWLENGKADADTVLRILAKRENIRRNIPNELAGSGGKNALTRGIAATVAGDPVRMSGILSEGETEERIALLTAARLTRTILPVPEVGALLSSPDPLLSRAARRYLETEDSAAARSLILAKYPDEIPILGSRRAFIPDLKRDYSENDALDELFESVTGNYFYSGNYTRLIEMEDRFRDEIRKDSELQAVFAFVGEKEGGEQVIRVFPDRITYSIYPDQAHFREKNISSEDYETFFNHLVGAGIDNLGPMAVGTCEYGCSGEEFIMIGRGGGRRIYFRGLSTPKELTGLKRIFEDLGRENMSLRYRLEDRIKGLEILLAEPGLVAHAVWKDGDDLRVLVEDLTKKGDVFTRLFKQEARESLDGPIDYQRRNELQQKRRERLVSDFFAWRGFYDGKLTGETVAQPEGIAYLSDFPYEEFLSFSNPRTFQKQFGGFEFRAGARNNNNLIKTDRNGATSVIKEGIYSSPLVTPDGRWVLASKRITWGKNPFIVRVNPRTGRELPVELEPADYLSPICFIPSHNRVLVVAYKKAEAGSSNFWDEKAMRYYLLDASTGAIQKVKGEFRPLMQQSYRGLQPTGRPEEFWAAIYDREKDSTSVGRYNAGSFTFETVLTIPGIELDSMNIWVDETEGKIYFVYRSETAGTGHLLRLPLPGK
ncbi:MAG: HEAT repeat domain-containing protein [Pyrinomonadaceae bacterium]